MLEGLSVFECMRFLFVDLQASSIEVIEIFGRFYPFIHRSRDSIQAAHIDLNGCLTP